ncbi:MAG: type IV pilin N-terminal domain-containing protein [Methanoregula sp.]|nr:type IV pilin N-terminal domain-containing protein [Methanoregula sp.]
MKQINNNAVSPVVGVMLMLVVTIIIAAVVSAFAGGLGGSQQKTPQVTLAAEPIIQNIEGSYPGTHPSGWTAANGIEFENTGGDTFKLSDINIQLEGNSNKYTITPADKISSGTCLPNDIKSGGYFQKIGRSSASDTSISPGDKFMFYADNCYINSKGEKYLVWKPDGTSNGIGISFGGKAGYMIIDKDSSKVMSSGYVVFR